MRPLAQGNHARVVGGNFDILLHKVGDSGRIKGNEALDTRGGAVAAFSQFLSAWAWRCVNFHYFGIAVMVRAPPKKPACAMAIAGFIHAAS